MTTKQEIEQEAAACRIACANSKVGDLMSHIHHELWLEHLTEPIENRISFILVYKPVTEQAERLRRLRPFDREKAAADWKKADADLTKALADLKKADADLKKAAAADWTKALADWKKADAADWKKAAAADWKKADAAWEKAYADPAMQRVHAETCGCGWSATSDIFGKSR